MDASTHARTLSRLMQARSLLDKVNADQDENLYVRGDADDASLAVSRMINAIKTRGEMLAPREPAGL